MPTPSWRSRPGSSATTTRPCSPTTAPCSPRWRARRCWPTTSRTGPATTSRPELVDTLAGEGLAGLKDSTGLARAPRRVPRRGASPRRVSAVRGLGAAGAAVARGQGRRLDQRARQRAGAAPAAARRGGLARRRSAAVDRAQAQTARHSLAQAGGGRAPGRVRRRATRWPRASLSAAERVRTVYLGTSDFAVDVLEQPRADATPPGARGHPPGPPARPRPALWRRRRWPSARRSSASRPIQPDDVNGEEARAAIAAAEPEAVLICAYGALDRGAAALRATSMLNVHPSLLPRWRGAAPIERAIEAGDEETGVTIMRPIAELDAGPMCLQRAEAIRPDDDYGSLATRLAGARRRAARRGARLQPPFREQPETRASPTPRRSSPADRLLDPARAADELERRVRALTPHVGAYLELPGRRAARRAPRGARGRCRRRRPGATERARRGSSSTAPRRARSSCSRCSRPAGSRWPPPTGCAATPAGSPAEPLR